MCGLGELCAICVTFNSSRFFWQVNVKKSTRIEARAKKIAFRDDFVLFGDLPGNELEIAGLLEK